MSDTPGTRSDLDYVKYTSATDKSHLSLTREELNKKGSATSREHTDKERVRESNEHV